MDWDELLKLAKSIETAKPSGIAPEELAAKFAPEVGIQQPTTPTATATATVPIGTPWWEQVTSPVATAAPTKVATTTTPQVAAPTAPAMPDIWGTMEWLSSYDDPKQQSSIATNIGAKLGKTIRIQKAQTPDSDFLRALYTAINDSESFGEYGTETPDYDSINKILSQQTGLTLDDIKPYRTIIHKIGKAYSKEVGYDWTGWGISTDEKAGYEADIAKGKFEEVPETYLDYLRATEGGWRAWEIEKAQKQKASLTPEEKGLYEELAKLPMNTTERARVWETEIAGQDTETQFYRLEALKGKYEALEQVTPEVNDIEKEVNEYYDYLRKGGDKPVTALLDIQEEQIKGKGITSEKTAKERLEAVYRQYGADYAGAGFDKIAEDAQWRVQQGITEQLEAKQGEEAYQKAYSDWQAAQAKAPQELPFGGLEQPAQPPIQEMPFGGISTPTQPQEIPYGGITTPTEPYGPDYVMPPKEERWWDKAARINQSITGVVTAIPKAIGQKALEGLQKGMEYTSEPISGGLNYAVLKNKPYYSLSPEERKFMTEYEQTYVMPKVKEREGQSLLEATIKQATSTFPGVSEGGYLRKLAPEVKVAYEELPEWRKMLGEAADPIWLIPIGGTATLTAKGIQALLRGTKLTRVGEIAGKVAKGIQLAEEAPGRLPGLVAKKVTGAKETKVLKQVFNTLDDSEKLAVTEVKNKQVAGGILTPDEQVIADTLKGKWGKVLGAPKKVKGETLLPEPPKEGSVLAKMQKMWDEPLDVEVKTTGEKISEARLAFEEKFTDKVAAINKSRTRANIEYKRTHNGENLPLEADAEVFAVLTSGAHIAGEHTGTKIIKNVKKIIRRDIDVEDVNNYLGLRHDIDVIKMHGEQRLGLGSVQGIEEVQRGIEELATKYGAKKFARLEEAAEIVRNYYAETMQRMVDEGIRSPELAKVLREQYPFYNPIKYNEYVAKQAEGGGGKMLSVSSDDLKALGEIGKSSARERPLSTLLRMAVINESFIARNRAVNSILKMAEWDPKLKGLVKLLKTTSTEVKQAAAKPAKTLAEVKAEFARMESSHTFEIGGLSNKQEAKYAGLRNATKVATEKGLQDIDQITEEVLSGAFKGVSGAEVDYGWITGVAGKVKQIRKVKTLRKPTEGMGTISRVHNDVVETYEVPAWLEKSAKHLVAADQKVYEAIGRALNAPSRYGMTVLSPSFMARNFAFDTFSAIMTKGVLPHHIFEAMGRSIKAIFKEEKFTELLIKYGGAQGGFAGRSREDIARTIAKGGNLVLSPNWDAKRILWAPFSAIARVGHAVEMTPRLAIFAKELRKGTPMEYAILAARRSTVDFDRSGWAMRAANNYYLYLNAGTQGTLLPFRALRDSPMARVRLAAFYGLEWGRYAWNRQFPEYADVADDTKYGTLGFMLPSDEYDSYGRKVPHYIAVVPNLREWAIFTAPNLYIMQKLDGKDPGSVDQFLKAVIPGINPVSQILGVGGGIADIQPPTTILNVIQDLNAEQGQGWDDFRSRPIIPDDMLALPAKERFTSTTSLTAKRLGEMWNISPVKIDYVIQNFLGGLGLAFTEIADSVLRKVNPVSEDPRIRGLLETYRGIRTNVPPDRIAVESKLFLNGLTKADADAVLLLDRTPEPRTPVLTSIMRSIQRNWGGQVYQTAVNKAKKLAKELGSDVSDLEAADRELVEKGTLIIEAWKSGQITFRDAKEQMDSVKAIHTGAKNESWRIRQLAGAIAYEDIMAQMPEGYRWSPEEQALNDYWALSAELYEKAGGTLTGEKEGEIYDELEYWQSTLSQSQKEYIDEHKYQWLRLFPEEIAKPWRDYYDAIDEIDASGYYDAPNLSVFRAKPENAHIDALLVIYDRTQSPSSPESTAEVTRLIQEYGLTPDSVFGDDIDQVWKQYDLGMPTGEIYSSLSFYESTDDSAIKNTYLERNPQFDAALCFRSKRTFPSTEQAWVELENDLTRNNYKWDDIYDKETALHIEGIKTYELLETADERLAYRLTHKEFDEYGQENRGWVSIYPWTRGVAAMEKINVIIAEKGW